MSEVFEQLLETVEREGHVESDLQTLSKARSLRAAFYRWRRGLGESELGKRADRVMVNVKGGRIRFYLQDQRVVQLVGEVLQKTA